MSEDTKVTMKNTKATILTAYQKLLNKLQEKDETRMDAGGIKETKKKQQAVEVADTSLSSNKLANLMQTIATFSEDVSGELDKYSTIKEAIEAKEGELKELFEIEKEAFTLAALVDSHDTIKEEFEKEMAEKKAAVEQQLADLRESISEAAQDDRDRRKKEQSEYAYDFERKKIKDNNELADALTAQKKVVSDAMSEEHERLSIREKVVQESEAILSEREGEIETLRTEVAAFPEKIAEAVKAKVGKEKGMLTSSHETEKKFMTAASESSTQVASAKIEEMEKLNEDLKATITGLQTKLDKAYVEIKEMAVKTVEGAGNTQMFQEMKKMMGDKTSAK